MEAETRVFPVINNPEQDVDKHQRMVALMERLRARNPQHKTWVDSKISHTPNMTEKRHNDAVDKPLIQKCLDTLQKAIKVCNHQSLLDRLDSIARQVGLTFSANSDIQVFISSDMFSIQIQLDKGGGVKDVKIVHQGDPMSCPELTEILQSGKFDEFVNHLEGLQKIYQLNGDKKIKTKGFLALQSIEKDLNTLAQLQSSIINGVAKYIHKSPLGILLPRKGGLPMELMYFVSPYDLLDKLSKTAHPLTIEAITEYNLGQRVTICMEPGPPKKLQTMPLMTVNKTADGKSLPSFTNISNVNSHLLPACFTLVLKQAIPVSLSVVQKIQSITNIEFGDVDEVKPLLDLLLDTFSEGKLRTGYNKQLYVSLPDQHHIYFINGVNGGSLDQPGLMVSSVPFVHPTSVPKILNCLRQQLLFNAVVSSVIRPNSNEVFPKSVVCELTTISMQQLNVTFEHPAHEDMVTVEMDLGDITSLKCRVATSSEHTICTDEFASKIFKRCMSVPITVRSVLKRGKEMLEKATVEAVEAMRPPPVLPPVIKPRPPPPYIPPHPQQLAPPPMLPNNQQMDMYPHPPPYPDVHNMSHEMVSPPSSVEKTTPLLANLLDHDGDGQLSDSTDSPMLSRLLEEQPMGQILPHPQPSMVTPNAQQKQRIRKRRSASDVFAGRSPKHRISDSSSGYDRLDSFDMDNSSSPFDAGGGGGGGLGGSFPASGSLGSVIDLTEDAFCAESNLKKLADSVDSLIPREMSRQSSIPDSELTALLAENDLGGRSLISRSSPQNSKNEKASISLEGLLNEVGDNDEADDPILANRLTASLLGGTKSDNVRAEHYNSTLDINLRNELFGADDEKKKSVQQLMTHRVPQHLYGKGSVKLNSDFSTDKKEIIGIFEKLEQPSVQKEKLDLSERSEIGGGNQVMKLKLTASGLRGVEGRLSSSSAYSSEPLVNKKPGSCEFDFHSDESDDEPPMLGYSSSDRLSMSVYSQSPTRLQISNKPKTSHDGLFKKTDKYKRKEAKYNSKGESVKRKKIKEESKKERKKRKLTESNQYVQPVKEIVYRSVESDQRTVAKLKIRVAKEPPVVTPISPEKDKLGESLKKSQVAKCVVSRQDSKESSKEKTQKSPHRSKSVSNSQESGKSDPKLAKATIRLKPLQILNSGSSVTVNSGQKSTSASGKYSSEIKFSKSCKPSASRTASPNLSASSNKTGSSAGSSQGKTSSPNVGRTTSSPSLSGIGKTASSNISVSGKTVLTPNLSATGKISSPNLSGSGKINSPSLSASGKTSSPILSASGKTTSPSVSGLAKSSSVNKTYNSVSKSSGSSSKSGSISSNKSSSLSSSKSGSSINSCRSSSSGSTNCSKNLSKSSSTSSLGNQNASMSMSAYLPNAPSASKVARLPPIPKLSSSQSSSQASTISYSSALHSPPSQSSSSSTYSSATSAPQANDTSTNQSTSKNKSGLQPIGRVRKGSLSAVIDKLTKATGNTNSGTENPETSAKSGYNDGGSRDPRTHNPKNDKTMDRVSSVQNEKTKSDFDRKVTRPDSDKFGNRSRNQENAVSKSVQKSLTINKSNKSDNSNISKRTFNNSVESSSSHGKLRTLSDAVTASPRLNSILTSSKSPHVSSPTTKSSPGILKHSNSQYSAGSDDNILQKSNKISDSNNRRERSHTPTNSSPREDPRLAQSNSNPDKSKHSSVKTVSPTNVALDLSISEKVIPSPKVAQGSSFVNFSAKFNGEVHKEEKEPFKVLAPKPQSPEFKENDLIDSPKRKVHTPIKNNLSPRSDASSPENGLIIDCPTTPTSNAQSSQEGSSQKHHRVDNCVKTESSDDCKKTSPLLKIKSSSLKDTTTPTTSPISTNSPCEIDDDLMDQALLGL